MKTITFEDGRVLIHDPEGQSTIEPCPKELSAEDVADLLERHGLLKDEEE